ncbi:MAG: pitrilysin family protein [Rhodothermales bacterium]
MLRLSTLGLLALGLVATPALAQKQTPPPGDPPRDFVLPAKSELTLSNGLVVTLIPYGTLPKATVQLIIDAGNADEGANEIWLADLLGDLMEEGTNSRSAEDIAAEAARMGGEINIGVGLDQTSIAGDVLSEFAPDILALIADIAQNPSLPGSEIDRLKRDRVRELSIQKTQPQAIALAEFRKVMYGEHPYGRIFPTEAMVEGYTIEQVRAFYNTHFNASRARLYIAGVFDEQAVRSAVEAAFGKWKGGMESSRELPTPRSQREVYIVDIPGAAQSNVYIGLPTIDPSNPDYIPLLVTNSLLGGSFGSRITRNIREEKGYTYSPFSSVSVRYRDGYWVQTAAVTTDVTGPAIKEIFYEINRLQQEPPSAEELDGIKNYMAGTFVLQNSSRQGIIGQINFLNLHGLPDTYLSTFVERIHAVTPDDVQRITQTYLRDEDMLIVISGDRKAIQSQVAGFGPIASD